MLRKNNIAYNAAFKKLLGLPKRFSNHVVCKILNGLNFEHYLNFRMTKVFIPALQIYFALLCTAQEIFYSAFILCTI